jgi:hypothetical protein
MNGRLYDPVLGRFLQADPIIQAPHNAQSHNRYSYVLNNPLSFTDPSGFSAWTQWRQPILAIAAAILVPYLATQFIFAQAAAGAQWALGMVTVTTNAAGVGVAGLTTAGNFITAVAGGFAAGGVGGGNIQSALQGALTAGLSFGVGELSGAHAAGGSAAMSAGQRAGQIAGHAAVGCISGAMSGGSCKAGAMAQGFSAFAGPHLPGGDAEGFHAGNFASRMVVGAVASRLGGGKYENGAMSAAFEYLFNHLATVGVSIKIPFIGGAKFSVGVSYEKSEWDAGLVIESDVLTASAGRMLGKAAVEAGYQTGDIRSNNASYSVDAAIGVIKGGASFQRDLKDDQISGGAISIGPQLGASVGAKKTATLSLRYDIVPPVTNVLNTVRNWWGK